MTHIRLHPRLGGGTRIRFRSEVNNTQRPVIRLLDALPHDLTVNTEAKVERIDFAYDAPQSRLEYLKIQVTLDLQVLADVVDRAFRMKPLMIPDSKLPCGQLPLVIPGC